MKTKILYATLGVVLALGIGYFVYKKMNKKPQIKTDDQTPKKHIIANLENINNNRAEMAEKPE